MQKSRVRGALPFLALAALIVLAYGAALKNGYVWDDRYFLVDFGWLDSFRSALRTAFSPLFMAEAYVRPLPLLTLYADSLFGEKRAAVSHGVNIALHMASSSLVFLLARDALRRLHGDAPGDRWLALAAAMLFAVHPALTEAVVWVSSRFDLMATVFMLAGLWLATRDNLGDRRLALGLAVLFLFAALSKELSAVFPVILAALIILRTAAKDGMAPGWRVLLSSRWRLAFAGMVVAGLAYMAVRLHVLSGISGVGTPVLSPEQMARTAATIARYIQLTFLPFAGNSPQHTFVWTAKSSVWDYLPQMAVSVLYVFSVVLLWVRRNPLAWVLIAWSVGYLPVIHLLPINVGNNTVQQRFMYLPTAVLFSLAPYGLAWMRVTPAARRVLPVLFAVLMVASIVVVRSIVPAWKAEVSLWLWARQIDPASSMARENLIWSYLDSGMYDEADREVALLSKDRITTSVNAPLNVGVSHYNRGNFELALRYYEMARTKIDSALPSQKAALYSNMAAAYALLHRDHEAASAIERAVRVDPNNHTALGNMLAFCDGSIANHNRFDEVVLRRAREKEMAMRQVLTERRPGDNSGLCPASFRLSERKGGGGW